jgi:hypothetical protein
MYARSSTLGLLAAVALSLPSDSVTGFTLRSSGAVNLSVAGAEAGYGVTREMVDAKPELTISLGATSGESALWLFTAGDELPRSGRYPIYFSTRQDALAAGGRWFHACFFAGTKERPKGVFHGQSGWVRINAVEGHLMSGEFEVRARGFLANDTADENQWVTLRGTFSAQGDSTITSISAATASKS